MMISLSLEVERLWRRREKDHDKDLWSFILRCREGKLSVKPKENSVQIQASYLEGPLLSSNGISPHSYRVQAIVDIDVTQRRKGGQAVSVYVQLYVPLYTESCKIVKPPTELTHAFGNV